MSITDQSKPVTDIISAIVLFVKQLQIPICLFLFNILSLNLFFYFHDKLVPYLKVYQIF